MMKLTSMPKSMNATVVPQFDKKDIEDNRVIACLSYIGILFLIPLLAKRDSKYCQEHAKQGLVLFIVMLVGSLIFWFPIIGWLLCLAWIIIDAMALLKCFAGEFWEAPVFGKYRSKINL